MGKKKKGGGGGNIIDEVVVVVADAGENNPHAREIVEFGEEVDVDPETGLLLQYKIDCQFSHELYCHFRYPRHNNTWYTWIKHDVGFPAVEVFGIYLFNLTERDIDVFGKIGYGRSDCKVIYDQPLTNPHPLKAYKCISLPVGSVDELMCDGRFTMSACLCDARTMSVVNTGWRRYDYDSPELNGKPPLDFCLYHKSECIGEDMMPMTRLVVHLSHYQHAIGANVSVKLASSSGAGVFGIITASSGLYPDCESVLFSKEEKDKEDSTCDDIKLLKSLVAIPLDGRTVIPKKKKTVRIACIIIRAYLPGIARGMVTFAYNENRSLEDGVQVISGPHGEEGISVSVKWVV